MKQSTKVLLFGGVYALIALVSINVSPALSLVYASLAAISGGLHVVIDACEK